MLCIAVPDRLCWFRQGRSWPCRYTCTDLPVAASKKLRAVKGTAASQYFARLRNARPERPGLHFLTCKSGAPQPFRAVLIVPRQDWTMFLPLFHGKAKLDLMQRTENQ